MIKNIFLFLLCTVFLFSNVNIKANKTFISGQSMFFEIEAIGSEVKFPKITNIGNLSVQEAGKSRSISNINGNITTKIIQRYKLSPLDDFTIPSFSILIDGKDIQTQALHIKKKKLTKTKSQYFDLDISLDKSDIYVGEQAVLNMTFKYKEGLQILDSSLIKPSFENFWFKSLDSSQAYKKDGYIIQDLRYLLFAQKEGLQKIEPLRVDLSLLDLNSNEIFSFQRERKIVNIYSNSLEVKVKSLPKDISLIGKFNIKATIDKNEINENEAISYKLEISGFGNIDDLEDINLNINNATVYENKAKIENNIKNDKNYGVYKKSFSLHASQDFTIPSIELKYFDQELNKVITKKTDTFNIKVKRTLEKTPLKLEKNEQKILKVKNDSSSLLNKEVIIQASLFDKILFFILGIVFSILSFYLYLYLKAKNNKKEDLPIVKKVKISKNAKELLKLLLPYLNKNKKLDALIFDLEKNNTNNIKDLKKQIIDILKEIK